MDFPYTLFDINLKKSFSKSDVAAFRLSVLNLMYDLTRDIAEILERDGF